MTKAILKEILQKGNLPYKNCLLIWYLLFNVVCWKVQFVMLNNTYGKTMTVVGSVIGLLSLNRSYKIGMSIFQYNCLSKIYLFDFYSVGSHRGWTFQFKYGRRLNCTQKGFLIILISCFRKCVLNFTVLHSI